MATAIEKAYQDFNQKEDQQNTSDVPSKNFEYKEPYKPSATAGILGLTAAGLGAVALRNPIARALNKMDKLVLPKLQPPAPSKQVVDEVTSITKIAPTRTERAKELITQEEAKRVISDNELARLKSEELRKKTYANPLQFGGNQKEGMGSALWDYIARSKSHKPRKASEWIKELTSKGPSSHKSGNPDFKNIDQSVKKDELWDSNLLQLDKDNRVVGGFLKYAEDKNLNLSKFELLYIINKSPINQLKTKRYSTTPGFVDQAERLGNEIRNATQVAETKLLSLQNNFSDQPAKQAVIAKALERFKDVNKSATNRIAQNDKMMRQGYLDESESMRKIDGFEDELAELADMNTELRNAGINIGDDFTAGIERSIQTNSTIKRGFDFLRQDVPGPKYGGYTDYRIPGGLSYHEDVTYYPGKLPFGLRIPDSYNKHYPELENQIYHIRYQMRQGLNPRQRIIAVDEIQSDYHQRLRKMDPKRTKVINPYGGEVEFFAANRKLESKLGEMKALSDKGRSMTKEDMANFYKLRDEFYEIKKNTLNMANMVERGIGNTDDKIPFLPLYGKENWGMHAIKNTIKESLKRGDADWIVINPVERIHHVKRTRYLGDMEFYGNSKGKAGFDKYGKNDGVVRKSKDGNRDEAIEGNTDPKKEATLPNMLKKLAQQYNSEVKTIEVAKSDVNKPFKVVRYFREDSVPKQFNLSKEDASEHLGAFRTREEAEAFANLSSGRSVEFIEQGDPRLYYKAFGLRISDDMKTKPFKAYNEGGLVVNIFA